MQQIEPNNMILQEPKIVLMIFILYYKMNEDENKYTLLSQAQQLFLFNGESVQSYMM